MIDDRDRRILTALAGNSRISFRELGVAANLSANATAERVQRLGAAHFLMKTREHVSTEMSLHVLAYNLRRVMAILGTGSLMQKMRA